MPFKGKTSDVVIFEQITDPFRPFFFLCIITVAIFVFDHANHTRTEMKSFLLQRAIFHAQIANRLRTEALFVLSIWSISWCKSNRSKKDEHLSLTFPVKQGKMFHFSSLVIKVWRAEMQSLGFFSIFGFDHANHTR